MHILDTEDDLERQAWSRERVLESKQDEALRHCIINTDARPSSDRETHCKPWYRTLFACEKAECHGGKKVSQIRF